MIAIFFGVALSAGMLAPAANGLSCTTQSGLKPEDRRAILEAGNALAADVADQKLDAMQAALLPAVVSEWDGMKSIAVAAKSLVQGGKVEWGDAYLLDATELKGPADSQFFCTNADSQITITINLHNLPPGKFALLIGDAAGAPLAGQLAFILGQDSSQAGGQWKLGGIFAREGALDGHDGVWYWSEARKYASAKQEVSAWLAYDFARWLLIPVDFLSSPHLDKLNREQEHGTNPANSMPLTVSGEGGKNWKINNLRIDTTLHHADVALTYESAGTADPAAARAEAVAVMSALLKVHPGIREHFHGLWAYAERDGRQNYAIELAMHDIP
ncbi:MAG TPA: hypothetical protein VIM62_06860 [Acidobacteriaceae bacterium]